MTYTLHVPVGTDADTALRLALHAAQQLDLPVTGTDSAGAVVLRVTRTALGPWAESSLVTTPAPTGIIMRAAAAGSPT